jgi:pimeloyl-ACP methyl ester carboxylesterase
VRAVTLGPAGREVQLLEGGDAGPAVWLVHGLDSSASSWLDVAPGLVDDHRVTAVDLPGFGRSPVGRRRRSLTAHADLIAELVRSRADDAVVLAGNSFGAVAAMLTASRHPWAVAGLVLLTPALPRRTEGGFDATFSPLLVAGAVPGMLALEPWRRSLMPADERVRTLIEAYAAEDSERPSQATFDAMVEADESRSRLDRIRGWTGAARSMFWWLSRPGAFHGAGDAVRAPVTLVEGLRDPVLPRPVVHATLERHPGWERVSLAGVGHLPQLERPAAVADTIRAVTGVR